TARLLELPYPGGPAIARLAEGGDADRFRLPRPMLNRDDLDFSFSGLKTAVMYALRKESKDEAVRRDMAAAIEAAIADVLVGKAMRACEREGVGHLVIAGGVAANRRLRARLFEEASARSISVHLPEPAYCTDNAAMIAYAGSLMPGHPVQEGWDAQPRWPLG
ncbi:MAG: tRNA (adenosine(37)-N6)-threonylcarbamoyltransferase complex transferase subunit TsaD, partial [Bacteroidetes bacterium]